MITFKRVLLQIIGTIFLAIGIIGIFLPLIPTTFPLLVACACYVRSSDQLYQWLINHHLLGTYIRDYYEQRAMSLKAKISAISLLWATILFSVFLFDVLWLRILLIGIALGVSMFLLFYIKTLPKVIESNPIVPTESI